MAILAKTIQVPHSYSLDHSHSGESSYSRSFLQKTLQGQVSQLPETGFEQTTSAWQIPDNSMRITLAFL